MKTREIEFWVEPEDIEGLTRHSVLHLYVSRDSVSRNGQMVKLIQQIPEKKIEITESEFDEAWRKVRNSEGLAFVNIKQELFGEEK